ncbi:hypothetical protein [Nocardia alni]|uniref:hypothetical protein n=1 Tax=Nocardia alni TaxID=2815723 RepID=UPI001C2231E8|nr:hypothetical protein [Nocardia alni]
MSVYHGPCRITVVSVEALWPQRVAVRVGRHTYIAILPGEPGASCQVDEDQWELVPQHWNDGQWSANIRNLTSDWVTQGDVEQQVIHSKDHDWPSDRAERNLVIALERGVPLDRREDRNRTVDVPRPTASLSEHSQDTQPYNDVPLRASSGVQRPVSPSRRRAARKVAPQNTVQPDDAPNRTLDKAVPFGRLGTPQRPKETGSPQ